MGTTVLFKYMTTYEGDAGWEGYDISLSFLDAMQAVANLELCD